MSKLKTALVATVAAAAAATVSIAVPSGADDRWYKHRHATLPNRPCVNEDDNGPCYWDAGVRGDTNGYSFWVGPNGGVHYLNPNR